MPTTTRSLLTTPATTLSTGSEFPSVSFGFRCSISRSPTDPAFFSTDYKGTDSAQTENNVQPEGYCSRAINGINPSDGATITNWYANYCEAKPDKACMVSPRAFAPKPRHFADLASSSSSPSLEPPTISTTLLLPPSLVRSFSRAGALRLVRSSRALLTRRPLAGSPTASPTSPCSTSSLAFASLCTSSTRRSRRPTTTRTIFVISV